VVHVARDQPQQQHLTGDGDRHESQECQSGRRVSISPCDGAASSDEEPAHRTHPAPAAAFGSVHHRQKSNGISGPEAQTAQPLANRSRRELQRSEHPLEL